jgi:hypothetical protein
MRRKDKQIHTLEEFARLATKCFCTIGMVDEGKAYLVPFS